MILSLWLPIALLAPRLRLSLPIDLFEVPDLGEVHVPQGAADLAIGAQIFGPEVVGHQLVGLGLQVLEGDRVGHLLTVLARHLFHQHRLHGWASRQRIGDTRAGNAEVVPNRGLEVDFLQGRGFDIAGREQRLDRGWLIRNDLNLDLGGLHIGPPRVVDQPQRQFAAAVGGDEGRVEGWVPLGGGQDNRGLIGFGQLGCDDRFVELAFQLHGRPLDDGQAAHILHPARFETGVGRVAQQGVGPLQPRVLEHSDLVGGRDLAIEFHAVLQRAIDLGNAGTEHRVIQTAVEGEPRFVGLLTLDRRENEGPLIGQRARHAGQHQQAGSPFDFRVARFDRQ